MIFHFNSFLTLGGTFNLGELLRNLNFIIGQLISFHRNIARISNIKYKHIEILLVISLFQTILHWFPWKLRNTYLVVKHSGFSKWRIELFGYLHTIIFEWCSACASETDEHEFFTSFQSDILKNLAEISDRLKRISLVPCLYLTVYLT